MNSVKAVHRYMKDKGLPTALSTLHSHIKKGRLKKRGNVYHQEDVDRYIDTLPKQTDAGISVTDLQLRKQAAEVTRAEEDARLKRLRADLLDGKLVPADLYEKSLAARAAILKRGLLAMCHSLTIEAVDTVDGDPNKGPLLLDMLQRAVNRHLHQYAANQEFAADDEDIQAVLETVKESTT